MVSKPKFKIVPSASQPDRCHFFTWRRKNGVPQWIELFREPLSAEATEARVKALLVSGLYEVIDERKSVKV